MTDPKLTPYEMHAIDVQVAIDRAGFYQTNVLGDRYNPDFSYTTGLLIRGHPELVTLGLDASSSAYLFGHIFDCHSAGVALGQGRDEVSDIHGLPFRLLPVPIEHWVGDDCLLLGIDRYYFDKAQYLSANAVLQVVWPDRNGRLPWDPLADPAARRDQPILADGDPPRRRTPLPYDIDNSHLCTICGGQNRRQIR